MVALIAGGVAGLLSSFQYLGYAALLAAAGAVLARLRNTARATRTAV